MTTTTNLIEQLIKDVQQYAIDDAEVSTQAVFINKVADTLEAQAKQIEELQADADRYRYLFDDTNLAAIKSAIESGKLVPTHHSDLIEQIIGFYNSKAQADALIDAACKGEKT